MVLKKAITELKKKHSNALQMGGPEKVKKRRNKGLLTARERVEKLIDPGSFNEMGLLAHSDMPGMEDRTPTDGLICGYGCIDGRQVGLIVNDFTVLASTTARVNTKKMLEFKEQVVNRMQIPLIWLGECGGARIPDVQGSLGNLSLTGGGVDSLMMDYTHFRNQPYIFAAMGDCYGVADWQCCAADFVVQMKGSAISISSPRALGMAIGQTYTGEEMGGWKVHSKVTGIADKVAEDEDSCFRIIKEYLDYMPSNNSELPPRKPDLEDSERRMKDIIEILPENKKRAYDMHKIIECIVDGGNHFELKPEFGKMLITCLARINGEVVGIVANNPMINVGAMNTDALDKLTSFLCLCDSYNIAIIFLHDTPGHFVGKEAESKKVSEKVVNALQALFQVTVPKVSIIVRKSYGQATVNMCGPGAGPDFIAAWPSAEIGFMEPRIAAEVVYGSRPESERKRLVDKMIKDDSPYPAAGAYYLQDIIDPRETRNYLIRILQIVRASKKRGIGEHKLANWPKKF